MAKVAIKIRETFSFWRSFSNNGAIWLQALICNRLNPQYEMQAVWLSIKRNHPFGFERLFLWRHMHRGHDLLLSAPTAAVRSTITSLRSEGGRRRNWAALSMNWTPFLFRMEREGIPSCNPRAEANWRWAWPVGRRIHLPLHPYKWLQVFRKRDSRILQPAWREGAHLRWHE